MADLSKLVSLSGRRKACAAIAAAGLVAATGGCDPQDAKDGKEKPEKPGKDGNRDLLERIAKGIDQLAACCQPGGAKLFDDFKLIRESGITPGGTRKILGRDQQRRLIVFHVASNSTAVFLPGDTFGSGGPRIIQVNANTSYVLTYEDWGAMLTESWSCSNESGVGLTLDIAVGRLIGNAT